MTFNAAEVQLTPASLRVLGALMEKEMTTPDAYPLSLLAVLTASNQRSSRDPVMTLTDDEVRTAIHQLQAVELVAPARDSLRVARYEHRIRTVLALRRDETALLCLLLLRGPQTPGELRGRADRMFAFDDLATVQAGLERLATRAVPLVRALARAPGSREIRFVHLLGPVDVAGAAASQVAHDGGSERDSVPAEDEVERLRAQIAALEERVRALETKAGFASV